MTHTDTAAFRPTLTRRTAVRQLAAAAVTLALAPAFALAEPVAIEPAPVPLPRLRRVRDVGLEAFLLYVYGVGTRLSDAAVAAVDAPGWELTGQDVLAWDDVETGHARWQRFRPEGERFRAAWRVAVARLETLPEPELAAYQQTTAELLARRSA
jgi:hypothetical protein